MSELHSSSETVLFQTLEYFHRACDTAFFEVENLNKLKKDLNLTADIPVIWLGRLNDFSNLFPHRYWNRDVYQEVLINLQKLYAQDKSKFEGGVFTAINHFFAGINSYYDVISIYNELNNISYEDNLKTRIYRNPLYTQICENCLMNLYRFFRDVINVFSPQDYSNQDTLKPIIDVLIKNGFNFATQIDINIRNAINHGTAFQKDKKIIFHYKEGQNHKSKELNIWQYDEVLNSSIDVISGILVGIFNFLSQTPHLFGLMFNSASKEIKFEWIRVIYKSNNVSIRFLDDVQAVNQLNISTETTIHEKNRLVMALIQIAKAMYLLFPEYSTYFVSYQHNRSITGWITVHKQDLQENINNDSKVLDRIISKQNYLLWDIQPNSIDERAYRFHLFPQIKSNNWFVQDISDISIPDYKRIKAKLIIDVLVNKKDISQIIYDVINQLKILYTPENPQIKVPFGHMEADVVFLYVYYKSGKRNTFSTLPSNENFICIAHSYKTNNIPKIESKAWKKLKRITYNGIEIDFNPLHFVTPPSQFKSQELDE